MKGFDHPDTTRVWDQLYYTDPLALRFYDETIARTLKLLNASPGDKVLDAGCGAGVHAIRAAKAGCVVDALDFSHAALEDARVRARAAGVDDQIQFFQEDLTHLSFADAAYNKIFSWGVLIHIREIETALNELARVLAHGGRLALYLCNSSALEFAPRRVQSWLTAGRARWRRLEYGYAMEFELSGDRIWLWHVDASAIANQLKKHGLRLVAKKSGEFSDVHLRFPGRLGHLCWRVNNLWAHYQLPPSLAKMNLLVFEKSSP